MTDRTDSADRTERPTAAANVPMGGGPGMSASFGVAAPVGAVKAKDRERAARTALHREGPSRVALHTELPGSVSLQRRVSGATWETVESGGPGDAAAPASTCRTPRLPTA